MIDQVVPYLYVSGAGPVLSEKGHQAIRDLKIKHILTISAMAIPIEKRIPDVQYNFIFAMDLVDEDLLSHMDEGISLIDKAIKDNESILVHCEAGMSRSVAIIAAYLMRRNKWNVEKALTYIKNCRPVAQPNEGFKEQLKCFERNGYSAQQESLNSSQEYRLWRNRTGNSSQNNGENSTHADRKTQNKYRCGRCRQVVFYEEHLIKHNRMDDQPCTLSYLIEPMKWMSTAEYNGKISCPSCNEKLGNYSWGGKPCLGEGYQCKHLITPWVHLHKSKIDVVKSNQQSVVTPTIPAVVIS